MPAAVAMYSHPALHTKAFHSSEMASVPRDDCQIMRQGDRSDAHVRLIQRSPCPLQLSSERPIRLRGGPVEREDADIRPDPLLKLSKKVLALLTLVGSVPHPPPRDGRRELLFRGPRGQAREQPRGRGPPQD